MRTRRFIDNCVVKQGCLKPKDIEQGKYLLRISTTWLQGNEEPLSPNVVDEYYSEEFNFHDYYFNHKEIKEPFYIHPTATNVDPIISFLELMENGTGDCFSVEFANAIGVNREKKLYILWEIVDNHFLKITTDTDAMGVDKEYEYAYGALFEIIAPYSCTWYNENNHHDNYANGAEGVAQSLNQRLSLIQGELPHFKNLGFPLMQKKCNKQMLDSYVINVVNNHPDITQILNMSSSVINHEYKCSLIVNSKYGEIKVDEYQPI